MTSLNLTERGVQPWATLVSTINLLNFLEEKVSHYRALPKYRVNKFNEI